MKRKATALLALLAAGAGVAAAQNGELPGRIGPDNRIQPSGRQLNPVGQLTKLGNHPGGGALTSDGRHLWALDAGRGRNGIEIVRVVPRQRCTRRGGKRRCRVTHKAGKVIQKIPLPGVNGGIVTASNDQVMYVSGTPESSHRDQQTPEGTPGKQGDVIHRFRYDARTGKAKHDGLIEVPAPSDSPTPQTFPPTNTAKQSWPRDLGISRDGKRLLAALNLADYAAVVNTTNGDVRYVKVGSYPYGAAVTPDGKTGLVSNESDGTVSVIDMEDARKVKDITVGPHLSHPEGIAIDRLGRRAYVAVAHQDLIAVIDLSKLEVERTLSVGRPEGLGTTPTDVNVSRDGHRLIVALAGSDEVAVFRLPDGKRRRSGRSGRSAATERAERVLAHEGRRGADLSENEAEETAELFGEEAEERAKEQKKAHPAQSQPKAFALIGRVPVGSYPVMADAKSIDRNLVWIAAKGLGVGPNPRGPNPLSPDNSDDRINTFQYLPSIVTGMSGILKFPTDRQLRKHTPRASKQIRPVNDQKPPPGTPIAPPGANQKIKHVFYIVRENRTYDQILGDDPDGDGDPRLTLFGPDVTPNAHALANRFGLLDHVYANSEASIDGHFWTSAAAVSDYVVKNWHQNYGGRKRPYDFGVYSVTWPGTRFLFDQAEKQGISYFNYGEAIAGVVPLNDKDRTPQETQEVATKFSKSDLGAPQGCFPNDASSGGVDAVLQGDRSGIEVFDSSRPPGASPTAESRFDCFRARFLAQLATNSVPAFNYLTLANDHTAGTTPGRRTPRAMVAENDWALGQVVDLVSKSSIWDSSLILVIEDDSQDGADHVDAHRIPAFAISPYSKRGAVIHTRYDFLSFIRTLQIPIGMKPLNLFDATAVPMYDVFSADPQNSEPYDVIMPGLDMVERNTASSANAKLSKQLPLDSPDRVPQRILDRILWQYVHGPNSQPPPPGPNAAGVDESAWRKGGGPGLGPEGSDR